MLPFRSGRTEFSGASAALLLFIFLSCAAIAAEKIAQPKPAAKSSPKESPKPQEGITNVPIPIGRDAKGLVLPEFDLLGHMRGRLEAGVTKKLDEEHVEFQSVKFTTFTPADETDLEISMSDSVFNLKTQVLNSLVRSTVKRADFEISGDKMQFEMITRKGTLSGNVRMIVRGKSRTPGDSSE